MRLILISVALVAFASPLAAQEALEPQQGTPPERIDILIDQADFEGPLEDCSAEQEAAAISGEIIVCRRRGDPARYGYDKEAAERRYARKTMNKGDPRSPDVFGIPDHGVVAARGCFVPPCPPPPAYFIDVEALPEAPPGSDADRIARGLPPLGRDAATPQAASQARAEQLGLPPVPQGEINPSESASPGDEPQG
ncbi:hypothetical protein P8Q88_08400 [Qipengyuania sp. XHP0207]|uniref:hypothetical protein n=1 Tax=Qipengyuania sp. XHP0207 TaxID=3038078 RepID=UPI0024201C46|nr:hypothetical protein [Qipengyuania sp. XHP0207]MDG5748200.1 hypothetical protein [Qipengyuania sp. XHP0207]